MNLAAGPPPIDQVGTVVSSLGGGHYIPIPASRPIFQSPNQGLSCVYKYTALDSELVFLCKWLEVPNVDPPTNQFFQKLSLFHQLNEDHFLYTFERGSILDSF